MSACQTSLLLTSLLLLVSSPLLTFAGLVLTFFYHVHSLVLVSDWFRLLPLLFYLSASVNLLSVALGPVTGLVRSGKVSEVSGVRCQVSGVRCQVSGL